MDGNLCCVVCPFEDMKKDCRDDHVIVVSTVKRPLVNPSLFRLGSCSPNSVTQREAVFNVHFNDCGFTRLVTSCSTQTLRCSSVLFSVTPVWCLLQVTGDQLLYSSHLTYDSSAEAKVAPFTGEPVVCEYKRWAYKTNFMTVDNIWCSWCVFLCRPSTNYPSIYETEFETSGFAALGFHLRLMNSACQMFYNSNILVLFNKSSSVV